MNRTITVFLSMHIIFCAAIVLAQDLKVEERKSSQAEDPASMTIAGLDAFIRAVQENNPDLVAARKRWDAQKARIPQMRSLPDPVVGVTFEKIPRGTLSVSRTMPDDRMLSLAQVLPLFGKLSLQGKIAFVETQMRAQEYKSKELELIQDAKTTYYNVFLNEKEQSVYKEIREVLRSLLRVVEIRYSLKEIPQADVFKLTLELSSIDNTLTILEKDLQTYIARLRMLIGTPKKVLVEDLMVPDDLSLSVDAPALVRQAEAYSPSLSVLRYEIEKNTLSKALIKKNFFSDLMLQLVQRGITSGSLGPWDIMLSFNLPLWFWTKQRHQIKEAVSTIEQAQAVYESMKNTTAFQIQESISKIESEKSKCELYRQIQIPILEASLRSSLAAYKTGQAEMLMVLDTLRMLAETKMKYYRALAGYSSARAELDTVIGTTVP